MTRAGNPTTSSLAWALIDPNGGVVGTTVSDENYHTFDLAITHLHQFSWAGVVWADTLAARKRPSRGVSWQAQKKCQQAVWARAEKDGWTIERVRVSRVSRAKKDKRSA